MLAPGPEACLIEGRQHGSRKSERFRNDFAGGTVRTTVAFLLLISTVKTFLVLG
jgi:hypothetical protein